MATFGPDDVTAAEPVQHAVLAVGSVQSRTVAAMQRAAYWRDEYATHGMEGLSAGCEQIRAAAETIHNRPLMGGCWTVVHG